MMTEKEYNRCIGRICAGKPLDSETAYEFAAVVAAMESLLDDADSDDVFGTEGWRYHVGWSE